MACKESDRSTNPHSRSVGRSVDRSPMPQTERENVASPKTCSEGIGRPIRDLFPLPRGMTFVRQRETAERRLERGEREREGVVAAAEGQFTFLPPVLLLLSSSPPLLLSFPPSFLVLPSAAADSICRSLLTRRSRRSDASLECVMPISDLADICTARDDERTVSLLPQGWMEPRGN